MGGLRHPMPRCVPLVRQAEGAQQPQPDGAAGADVSEAPVDSGSHTELALFFCLFVFLRGDSNSARERDETEGFCSLACRWIFSSRLGNSRDDAAAGDALC